MSVFSDLFFSWFVQCQKDELVLVCGSCMLGREILGLFMVLVGFYRLGKPRGLAFASCIEESSQMATKHGNGEPLSNAEKDLRDSLHICGRCFSPVGYLSISAKINVGGQGRRITPSMRGGSRPRQRRKGHTCGSAQSRSHGRLS